MIKLFFFTVLILFNVVAGATNTNNTIHIGFCSLLNSESVIKKLNPDIYSYEILIVPKNIKKQSACQAIWVGIEVPLKDVKEIITKSIQSGIKLNYIGIHGDYDFKEPPKIINNTVTIGASTYAAKKQGLEKINPLKLNRILSSKTLVELHSNIRKTYSIMSKRNWLHRLKK